MLNITTTVKIDYYQPMVKHEEGTTYPQHQITDVQKAFMDLAILKNECLINHAKGIETEELKSAFDEAKDKYLSLVKTLPKSTSNKIAVYAICKDEEQNVKKWYQSMSEADYICVLDTGSTDHTYDLFKQIADTDSRVILAQAKFNPWRFDLPRNISMTLIPDDANILLCTDLDEILLPGWGNSLRSNWIEGKHQRAIYLYAWSHNKNGSPARVFWYDKVHTKNSIWNYPVHELLVPLYLNDQSEEYLTLSQEQMFLHHYPLKKDSRSSYLSLLEQRRKEDETDFYGLYYLAREYGFIKEWNKMIEILDLAIDLNNKNNIFNNNFLHCLYLFYGDAYWGKNNIELAIKNYKQAINYEPTFREGYLKLASIYIISEKYNEAIIEVQKALEKTIRHYSWIEDDYSWSWQPFDILCNAYYYQSHKLTTELNDYLTSLYYAELALQHDKENIRLQQNLNSVLNKINEITRTPVNYKDNTLTSSK